MQQIPNIVKIEDNDCNSLTVEVGSDTSDENINKKTNLKEKENNKWENLKNVKKEKKLENDLEFNTEKLNNIRNKKNCKWKIVFFVFFYFYFSSKHGRFIQLPYGVISEKNDPENELQFNFPPNFRKASKIPFGNWFNTR